MKKYIAAFSLLLSGVSYSMEKETNGCVVKDEYGSEIAVIIDNPSVVGQSEKERVVLVKGRMRYLARPVKLPSVANERQKLLLEQAAKLRARL
jgi:hypothetical protein